MKLRIQIENDFIPDPDTDDTIYANIEMVFPDVSVQQGQQMAIELAGQAHSHYTNRAEGVNKI